MRLSAFEFVTEFWVLTLLQTGSPSLAVGVYIGAAVFYKKKKVVESRALKYSFYSPLQFSSV